jgi:bis(5'-nucleosidyl)-tetraphosphatase
MKKTVRETSAGAVVYRIEHKDPHYLLLHYPTAARAKKEYWDFPKGHVESGESLRATAAREVEEETGLANLSFHESFKEQIHYYFEAEDRKISKTVTFFLSETAEKNVRISHEHIAFIWLSFDEALHQLKFANAKRILKKAHAILCKQGVRSGTAYSKRKRAHLRSSS